MPKTFDISISDFSGGKNSYDPPRSLRDNESQELLNFEVVGRGSIQKRYGSDKVSEGGSGGIRGLHAFHKVGAGAVSQLMIFNNAKLYTITASATTWVDKGSYGTDTGELVGADTFNNLAVFGNGLAANTVQKWDGTTRTVLGGTPPDASVFAHNQHVQFSTGDAANPGIVSWCDVDDNENWTTGIASNQDVAINDGSIVRAIDVHLTDDITIYKDGRKYAFTPVLDGTSELPLGFVSKGVPDGSGGTRSPHSLQRLEDGTIFLSSSDVGFQKYGTQENLPDRRNPLRLSQLIAPDVKQIDDENIHKAAGVRWDQNYICSVPKGVSTQNNHSFVFNTVYGAWSESTRYGSAYEIFPDETGQDTVYFGAPNNGTLYRFNNKFIDGLDLTTGDGSPIDAQWASKIFRMPKDSETDMLVVSGAITVNANVEFFITVRSIGEGGLDSENHVIQNGVDKTEKFFITDSSIITADGSEGDGAFGTGVMGHGYVGGGATGSGTPDVLYEFKKEIALPSSIREADEVQFSMRSRNKSEGIRLDFVGLTNSILN